MSAVRAPYPSRMEEIDGASIISIEKTETNVIFRNRAGDVVADFLVERPDSMESSAIVRVGSMDQETRDVLVKEWHRAGSPNAQFSGPGLVELTGSADCVAWSPDGKYLAIGGYEAGLGDSSLDMWKRDGDTFTRISMAGLSSILNAVTIRALAWSPDGQYLLIGIVESPYLLGIQRTTGTDTFASYTLSLGTTLESPVLDMSWSEDGRYLVVTAQPAEITAVPISFKIFQLTIVSIGEGGPFVPGGGGGGGDVFLEPAIYFTPMTNPTVMPGTGTTSVSLSADGTYLAVGLDGSPFLYLAKRVGTVWTKLTDVDFAPLNTTYCLRWSPDDVHLAVGDGAKRVWVYKRVGDIVQRSSSPDILTNQIPNDVGWSPDGKFVAAAHASSPYMSVYKVTSDATHKMIPPPAVLLAGIGYGVAFSPDGMCLAVAHATSPYATVYKSALGALPGAAVRVRPLFT